MSIPAPPLALRIKNFLTSKKPAHYSRMHNRVGTRNVKELVEVSKVNIVNERDSNVFYFKLLDHLARSWRQHPTGESGGDLKSLLT